MHQGSISGLWEEFHLARKLVTNTLKISILQPGIPTIEITEKTTKFAFMNSPLYDNLLEMVKHRGCPGQFFTILTDVNRRSKWPPPAARSTEPQGAV